MKLGLTNISIYPQHTKFSMYHHHHHQKGLVLWCLTPLSTILVEESGVPRENHIPAASH